VESPATSAADVMSAAARAGAVAASEADKIGTSASPAAGGEGGDRGTTEPQEEPPSGGIFVEGIEAVNDEYQCLYAGTPVGGEGRYRPP
jgi:hypothetical protein